MGTVTGMAVSALVPPDGWDCRHIGELLILLAWLLSARADVWLTLVWPLEKENQNTIFWITFVKDLAITIATMGGIITTQVGVFNRCSCWTRWGATGLALPEMPDTAHILFHRINTVYPAITFTSISIALIIIPLFISGKYKSALRTFVQRDDRKSNAIWLWHLLKRYHALKTTLRLKLRKTSVTISKGSRTNTVRVEEGHHNPLDSFEMQPLTLTWSEEPMDLSSPAAINGAADAGVVPAAEIAPLPVSSKGDDEDEEVRASASASGNGTVVESSSTGSMAPRSRRHEMMPSRPETRRRFTEMSRTTI